MDRTFSIIKPDATKRNLTGAITKLLRIMILELLLKKELNYQKKKLRVSMMFIKINHFFLI